MILVGIDMAFAHMGLARFRVDGAVLTCLDLLLVSTAPDDSGKVVRKSSTELRRARELQRALVAYCSGATLACVEVPSGSQSASAARALGIAVGVLSSCPIPIVEVTQREVKMASVGKPTASKPEVIAWAGRRWPTANWRTVKRKGVTVLTADNEHLADACGAVCAGIATDEFQRLLAYGKAHALPDTPVQRPAPDSAREGRLQVGVHSLARRRLSR